MKPTLSEAMKARLADLCGDDRVIPSLLTSLLRKRQKPAAI